MEHSVSFVEPTTVSLAETSLLTTPPPESNSTASKSEDKKSVKKRKSWGQELPTPKTNLPPRKRAKTEDEKEQRRIERVLRNRQAAQSSRERKRLEVEKLEGECDMITNENRALKTRLMAVEEEKFQMAQQMEQMREMMKQNGLELPSPPTSPILAPQSTDLFGKSVTIKQEFNATEFYDTPTSLPSDHRSSVTSGDSVSAQLELSDSIVTSDLAQHPAVPVPGAVRTGSSISGSRRNSITSASTPATSLSDGTFDNLFESGNSPLPATSFFEEGYSIEGRDSDANNLELDNLVDFDSELSAQAIKPENYDFDGANQFDPFSFDINPSDTIIDFSHQSAATSSLMQPSIGASS